MHQKLSSRIKSAFVCLLFAATLSACNNPEGTSAEQYSYSIFAFGTLIDVSLYDVNHQQAQIAFEQLQQNFDRYHQQWSPWRDGDLAKMNRQLAEKSIATVPENLRPLLEKSLILSQQSENYYNPGIGNLINLWQFHKHEDKNIQPPDAQLIDSLVQQNPTMSDITISDNNRISSNNAAISFNFGAFAKGYAIGLEMQKLRNMDIQNAVINAGGDLSVIGQHGDRAWNIGIRHPRNNSILASIKVKNNESVFTSGDYERYYFYQEKRFHHILNPLTGYPADGAQSVTVLHHDAATADAAATALFVAGSKNWQRIAKKMAITHVMLVDNNGDIHLTPAMHERIKILNKSPASHIFTAEEL